MKHFIVFIFLILTSCVHKHEAAETDSAFKGFLFRIGSPEVRAGDRVAILKEICDGMKTVGKSGLKVKNCTKKKIGEGIVVEVVDAGSAFIRPSSEIEMGPDLLVEKE